GNGYIYVNGVKVRQSEYNANGPKNLGYPLLKIEEQTAVTLLNNALQQISTYVGSESLIQQIVEVNDHGPTVSYSEITGGMDKFPAAFLPGLAAAGVKIHKGHRLT